MTAPAAEEQEVWDRLWATDKLPRGRAQIAALETVLREADALGSPALRYATRIFITSAYQQGGEPAFHAALPVVPHTRGAVLHDGDLAAGASEAGKHPHV